MTRGPVAPTLCALLVVAFLSLAYGATNPLLTRTAKLRLKPFAEGSTPRHSVKLDVRFSGLDVDEAFRATSDPVEVWIGGTCAVRFDTADGTKWNRRKLRRWKGKAKRTPGCPGKAKIDLDTSSGRMKLTLKKIDLSAVLDADRDDVGIRLILGDREFAETVSFSRTGHRWGYHNSAVSIKGPGTGAGAGGGGGGEPDDPQADKVLNSRMLAWASKPREFPLPNFSLRVLSQADWLSAWKNDYWTFYASTPPTVDFGKEMVLTLSNFPGLSFADAWFERKNGQVIGHITIVPKVCTGGYCGRMDMCGAWAVERTSEPVKYEVKYVGNAQIHTDYPKDWPVWPF